MNSQPARHQQSNRRSRSWLLLCTAITLANGLTCGTQAAGRPNFLVILCDDLGYGDLACYGHPTIRTPHLDALAQEGMLFTDCYAAAPVCSASRAGLLSGKTPSRVGVYDWIPDGHVMHLRRDEQTIATRLQAAGYATCHVGKWHCNGKFNEAAQPQPGDHGFDHWFATQNNAAPSHRNPVNFVRNGEAVGPLTGYSCQLVADEAVAWLKQRDPQRPFFQFVCFHEPHEPIDSPPDLTAAYPGAQQAGEALYYANVTNMDRAVGRILEGLAELNLEENTLLFFTSDNGPETLNRYQAAWRSHGSPGALRGMKLHLYEAGIRVPGILRYPAIVKAGQTVRTPICSLDLLPTLCELAGVSIPDQPALDGTSLVSLFAEKPWTRDRPLFWHYFRSIGKPKAALRQGDWMVLGHWDGPQLGPGGSLHPGDMEIIKSAQLTAFELYDLRADRSQQRNLASELPDQVDALSKQLRKKYHQVQNEGHHWVVGRRN